MGQVNIDSNDLKSAIRGLMLEEPKFFIDLFLELNANVKAGKLLEDDPSRREKITQIIEDNFREYDEVFRALA